MAWIKPVKIIKRGCNFQLYYYNPRGERRRLSVGIDYQQAQRLAVRFNDWLLEGKDPEQELEKAQQIEQAREITLREFYPIFMERHGKFQSKNMQSIYHYCFKHLCRCPSLVDIPLPTISKKLMLDYMHARLNQDCASPATINRETALVKNMLFRATEWDMLDHNPLQGLRLFSEADKRKVDLTPEQAAELVAELSEPMSSIVEFAIYSGFRKENILSMRIESILFHDLTPTGEVPLRVKGGRIELFPLGPTAVELLKRVIGERKKGFVFINPQTKTRYSSINKTFDRVVRRLGFTVNGTKLRIHDLRHVFATWLLRAGVSLEALRELMGHKDRSTTDRYATYDRMEASKHLSLMPRIAIDQKKECPDSRKAESF